MANRDEDERMQIRQSGRVAPAKNINCPVDFINGTLLMDVQWPNKTGGLFKFNNVMSSSVLVKTDDIRGQRTEGPAGSLSVSDVPSVLTR